MHFTCKYFCLVFFGLVYSAMYDVYFLYGCLLLCFLQFRLVVKTALKLLLVFVDYTEPNTLLLLQAIDTVDTQRGTRDAPHSPHPRCAVPLVMPL